MPAVSSTLAVTSLAASFSANSTFSPVHYAPGESTRSIASCSSLENPADCLPPLPAATKFSNLTWVINGSDADGQIYTSSATLKKDYGLYNCEFSSLVSAQFRNSKLTFGAPSTADRVQYASYVLLGSQRDHSKRMFACRRMLTHFSPSTDVRKTEYVTPSSEYQLVYVEVIHRHHRRTLCKLLLYASDPRSWSHPAPRRRCSASERSPSNPLSDAFC